MTHLDDDDLRALIDSSFGDGPPERALGAVLGAGRRAVRRRRAALAGTTLAVALAVTGGAFALAGDGTTTGTDPVPPATQAPEPGQPELQVRTAPDVAADELVRIAGAGVVDVRPGVEVLDEVDDPYEREAPGWSVAVRLRYDGEPRWVLLDSVGDTGSMEHPGPGSTTDDFERWVRDTVALQAAPVAPDPTRTDDGRDLVRLDAAGEPVLLDGVTLLERVDGPRPGWLAVAVGYDDRVRWIAIETAPGDNGPTWSVTGAFADDRPGRTFEQFAARTSGAAR